MDIVHSKRWCAFVMILFWCVVDILSRSPRWTETRVSPRRAAISTAAQFFYTLDRNIGTSVIFYMNECFQITLGCYGSVCACARAPVIAYLRDAGDAALELLMMLQKTGSSNKALRWNMLSARWTRRAQTTKQVQAGSCAALPPLGCLLFQRHTADTRFSFISSQEQWLSAHCVVYVFAFSPVPAVCPVALSWLETVPSGTSLWAERDCAAGRASSSRCVVRQCDGGASIHRRSNQYTPTLHITWYGLICTTIQGSLKGGGTEG